MTQRGSGVREKSRSTAALHRLVGEARAHFVPSREPRIHVDALVRSVRLAEPARESRLGLRLVLLPGMVALTAALVWASQSRVAKTPVVTEVKTAQAPREPTPLGGAASRVLRADTAQASHREGDDLRVGDVLRVDEGMVQLAREQKVFWAVEGPSEVVVKSLGETLVLALTRGSIEAEVTPVRHGEAFAIDVGGVRVAVHGTHFRISREGERVTIDLSEGVLAVGDVPASGLTQGKEIVAPAHAEFVATRWAETLLTQKTRVKPALDVTARELRVEPPKTTPRAEGSPKVVGLEAVRQAVVGCLAKIPVAQGVTTEVATTAQFRVAENGTVSGSIVFSPPLEPSAQTCAVEVLRGARLDVTGPQSLSVSYKK